MSTLDVAIDLGESLTKVIYKLESQDLDWLAMNSGLARISEEDLGSYLSSVGVTGISNPSSQMWVKTASQGIVGIGRMAANFINIRQSRKPKYEDAIAKVLAVIARIINIKGLARLKSKVNLSVLLPFDEKANHQLFRETILEESSSFEFCGDLFGVELVSVNINSEGAGLFMAQSKLNSTDWLATQQIGLVMLGHRNTSAIHINCGHFTKAQSPLIGFEEIMKSIVVQNPGVEVEALTKAIWKAIAENENEAEQKPRKYPKWSRYASVKNLITAHSTLLRKKELKKLSDDIDYSLRKQEEKLTYFFNQIFPKDLDTVLIGGGSMSLFTGFVNSYFKNSSIIWNKNIIRQIETQLSMQQFGSSKLAERFADLFGYFMSTLQETQKATIK